MRARIRIKPPIVLALLLSVGMAVPASSLGSASGSKAVAPAHTARILFVEEKAHLHLVSTHGLTIKDSGTALGTFNCQLVLKITAHSAVSGSATFTARPRGGSIKGRAKVSYELLGTSGDFEGSIRITGGTGRFAKASGNDLRIKGKIDLNNYSLTTQLQGELHL
jgi:hypothetical protein